MQKKSAIRWLLPAVIILLLHTLLPNVEHYTHHEKEHYSTTCHHESHGVWEFFEHLLSKDCGFETLENYHVSKVEFNQQHINFNTLFITNNFSFFYPLTTSKIIHKIIPFDDFIFSENRFVTDVSFRGPPSLV
jgi:hypothetical protein